MKGNKELVKLLIAKGADIHTMDKYKWAAFHGHIGHLMNSIIDVMEILLENGADANVADKNGSTSLMGASINGHLQIIKFLIKEGTRNSWV